MKSLEEVIKYKFNFLPKGTEPFYTIQTYTAERAPNLRTTSVYSLYEVKERIFSNDSFSLMEDITPLFIYISSCDKYYRENGHGEIYEIAMHLIMVDGQILRFGISNAFSDIDEHRISDFKEDKNNCIRSVGYCECYTEPFKIWFDGFFQHFQTEEERLEVERRDREIQEASQSDFGGSDDEENLQEEFSINDSRTFKLEECVICLEEEPKVLFCNCGHLCICKKCLVRRFDNCPVCKKENTILRIIE